MISTRKKRHITETDKTENSIVTPQKKKMLKTEETGDHEIQSSQTSTVLFELEENVNSMNIDGNTSQIKVERDEDDENHIAYNDAEENEIDSKASISAVFEKVDEATPTKKKKKKHRELSEADLMTATEDGIENALVDDVPENAVLSEAVETPVKKKKKKKSKKHISPEHSDNDVEDQINEAQTENKNADKEKIDEELSFSETKRMFDDIQQKLMSNKYSSTKSFWEKYSFHPYSNENCRAAFEKIMAKVQKRRTMLELVNAAGKMMEESPKIFFERNKQIKPVSAFKLFSESNYKKISKKHPEYRGIQILNKITKKWTKISDHKKLKYIDLALARRDDYMEEIKHCYQIDPSFVAKPILTKVEWRLKDRCAGLPDAPPRNGFALFHQKSGDLYNDLSNQDKIKKLALDFKLLPDEVKKQYDKQVKEQIENYKVALDKYLDTLSPGEREERSHTFNFKLKKSKEKKPLKSTDKHVEKIIMKKPPQSGYLLYYSELSDVLKYVPVIQRHVIVSEKWKALSEDERIAYNKKRLTLYNEWLNKLKFSVNEDIAENTINNG